MDEARISAFWADARLRGGINPVAGYLGATAADTLPPPAWSFGTTPQEADRLLELVLEGRKTATATALWDYEEEARARAASEEADDPGPGDAGAGDAGASGAGEGGDVLVTTDLDLALPAPGALSIVLDGDHVPRALVRTTHVDVVRFGEVDEAHARREGEDSLEHWRARNRRELAEHAPAGTTVDDGTQVVLERFVVLVPATARRAAKRAGLL